LDAPGLLAEPFTVDWLGGYWKLPQVASDVQLAEPVLESEGVFTSLEESLAEARSRIVSSFSSAEKRTAPVEPSHLEEVYRALAPALPRVFQAGPLGVQVLMSDYRQDPLLCAFALARSAAGMRANRLKKAEGLLELARGMVPAATASAAVGKDSSATLPERSVLSYIDRNLGVCRMLEKRAREATAFLNKSLLWLPTNAAAYYIKGRCHEDMHEFEAAAGCQARAVALDPDFKLPYIGLANCQLRLGKFAEAAQVSQACLLRHPDAALAHLALGQAVYHMAREGDDDKGKLINRGRAALEFVRQSGGTALFQLQDERMLEYFQASPAERDQLPKEQPHPRKVQGWRP